jgi:hypothetical protein
MRFCSSGGHDDRAVTPSLGNAHVCDRILVALTQMVRYGLSDVPVANRVGGSVSKEFPPPGWLPLNDFLHLYDALIYSGTIPNLVASRPTF